jgi:riboflavin kinase/FMN adenylyltransferase
MSESESVVTIGAFDGVHLGHQAILKRAAEIGQANALKTIAYTFILPPRFASLGCNERCLILPNWGKRKLLEEHVSHVNEVDFAEVQTLNAEAFLKGIVLDELHARAIVVGTHFRFGHKKEGDVTLLQQIGAQEGVPIVVVPPVIVEGVPVSSTHIRTLITAGKVEEASALLGRPYLLTGEVVKGERLGRKMGYPTANLRLDPRVLLPKEGVYYARAFWSQGKGTGLFYVGTRPTVGGETMNCELHLLSPPQSTLLGERLEVHVITRLRDDQRFPSLNALQVQIAEDVRQAHLHLGSDSADLEPILA